MNIVFKRLFLTMQKWLLPRWIEQVITHHRIIIHFL
jgi:hypothetical protein